jgi:hypothetical protein
MKKHRHVAYTYNATQLNAFTLMPISIAKSVFLTNKFFIGCTYNN